MSLWRLVYDGDCGLCSRAVDVLRRWDRAGRLEFVPFQTLASRPDLASVAPEAARTAVQLVSPTGEVRTGADAAAPLLRLLPGTAPLRALLSLPGANRAARRVYNWVARNRHRLPGARRHCAVNAGTEVGER